MNAVVYLLQVSACMGIFYLFYYLLLSRYTFFTINRWYLLTTLAISFIIPLLTITVRHQETLPQMMQQVVYINKMQIPEDAVLIANENSAPLEVDWMGVLKLFYAASVAALLIRLVLVIAKFFTRIRKKKRTKIGGINIVRGDKNLNNGSFFNFIFLNGDELSADDLQQIIAHEMLHVKLYHSVDRVLVKIAQVFLWFNPFVYLYARAMEENHEFEVDREVGNATDRNKYAELLLHLSVAGGGTLYHNFSMVPLKKRITMLFTKPTRKIKRVIYLLVAPLIVISCLAFAKLKNENPGPDVTKSAVPPADSAVVKYRQKSKLTPAQRQAQDEEFKKLQAYFETGEGLKKRQIAEALTGKTMTFEVEDLTLKPDNKGGDLTLKQGNQHYNMYAPKNLLTLKKGDEIVVNALSAMYNRQDPLVTVLPQWVTKDGKKIYEAEKLVMSAFLYESNKVRFTDGRITNITRYPNGKWKSAVVEKEGKYRFNLSFKPTAPDLNSIANGDQVRLRFVHEVKTGTNTYAINDWVAISADIKDYGIKNPEYFFKFYEVVKADTGRLSVINGINALGPKPLVLINGKEYDKEILYKISSRGMGVTSVYPPNNGNTMYGERAKDGAVVIDYPNGDITYLSATDMANLKKRQAAKGKFFSRIRLTKDDGSKYDMAILNRASGSSASANLPVNGKIAFIVNNKVYNEANFKRLFPVDKASYGPSIGVGGATKELKERGFKLDGYSLVFHFDAGNSLSAQNAHVKEGTVEQGTKLNNKPRNIIQLYNANKKPQYTSWQFGSFNPPSIKVTADGKIVTGGQSGFSSKNYRFSTSDKASTIDEKEVKEPVGKDTVGLGIKATDQLLAKIPGMEVKADGTVWINNMPVTKARINGVDYDAGVIESAIKTLPAELIEKFTRLGSRTESEPSGVNGITNSDIKKQ